MSDAHPQALATNVRGGRVSLVLHPTWAYIPFNLILACLIFIALRHALGSFNTLMAEDLGGRIGLLRGFTLWGTAFVCFNIAIWLCVLLSKCMAGRRYVFRNDGIEIIRLLVRIPIARQVTDLAMLSGFGFANLPHTSTGVLRFYADGTRYVVLTGVAEWQVSRFIDLLQENGIVYSSALEPNRRSKTAANTLLG